jgi:hypothetical protein
MEVIDQLQTQAHSTIRSELLGKGRLLTSLKFKKLFDAIFYCIFDFHR